jgi:hypothetical protein
MVFLIDRYLFSQYAMTIPRPFGVHYNPYTQAIEVIDGREQIVNMVRTLRSTKLFFFSINS